MVINTNKILTFLAVLPLFLPNHLFLLVLILPVFPFLINRAGVGVFSCVIVSLILGGCFFFRDYLFNYIDYTNFKLTYFFSSLLLAWNFCRKNYIDIVFLRKIFIFYTLLNFFVIILQMIAPSFFVWRFFAENDGQYASLLDQGRMFGLSGNPTHSGYLTMLVSLFLISLREKVIYIVLSFLSVVLILNKMTILIMLVFGFLLYCFISKRYSVKVFVFLFGLVVSFFVIFYVIMPYIYRWAEVGYDTHTITYRMEIYEYIINEFRNSNYLFFGKPDFYSVRSMDAFDSLPALIIIKYGVLVLIFMYLLIFSLTPKNIKSFIMYFSLVIPGVTMVAYYNTFYTLSIFILYFSTVFLLSEQGRKN